jgi:hypothetical protein
LVPNTNMSSLSGRVLRSHAQFPDAVRAYSAFWHEKYTNSETQDTISTNDTVIGGLVSSVKLGPSCETEICCDNQKRKEVGRTSQAASTKKMKYS